MRITPVGNVGIGTDSPGSLDVVSGTIDGLKTNKQLRLSHTNIASLESFLQQNATNDQYVLGIDCIKAETEETLL